MPFERLQKSSSEEDYVHRLETLLFQTVDVVVTHDGPDVPDLRLLGSPIIRGVLERLQPPLVVRGHAYWRCPLAILDGGTQILNVDGRTVILRSVRRVTAMNLGDSAMSSI